MNASSSSPSRRQFFRHGAATMSGLGVATAFHSLLEKAAAAEPGRSPAEAAQALGYGPLREVRDETTGLPLVKLPEGFRYISYGWTGEPMDDGTPTPPAHDGMSVIATDEQGVVTLCRNHEVSGDGRPFAAADLSYDAQAPGGCTLLRFDTKVGKWLGSRAAISGTSRNCAGGPTPWGSWLTCEETVDGPGDPYAKRRLAFEQDHGWIFEVPAEGAASPVPLKDMGRFNHEAVAVDPATGIVYETEDRNTGGFYRYLPNTKGKLAEGGRLQMMKVPGRGDLRRGPQPNDTFDVTWVEIEDRDRRSSPGTNDGLGVYNQGKDQGATTFARLEGCWAADGKIYFTATNGGRASKGQVWEYTPAEEQLRLVYESPSGKLLDYPDNMCVSPRGGIVLCEDGDAVPERLHGLTLDGGLFHLASNNIVLRKGQLGRWEGDYRSQEWCGASFSPDGQWLFVNIQTPGVTFAITGPWEEGAL